MVRKKYDSFDYSYTENSIKELLMQGESVLWSGNPKKSAFILNKSFIMMPVGLLWLLVDGYFLITTLLTAEASIELFILILFFAFHLIPAWIWLWNVLSASKKWANTEYCVTDKRIIIRGGVIGYNYQNIYYPDISSVDLHVGIIDKMLGVGDIVIATNSTNKSSKNDLEPKILDIEKPQQVFKIIQKTVLDIQTDIHYPNDLRPDFNHGYNTTYRP